MTYGDRPLSLIPISTTSFPLAALHWTDQDGPVAYAGSSCPSTRWAAFFRGKFVAQLKALLEEAKIELHRARQSLATPVAALSPAMRYCFLVSGATTYSLLASNTFCTSPCTPLPFEFPYRPP